MHDFHFYNKKRLLELHEKEIEFSNKYEFEAPPEGETALTEDEEKERTKLLEEVCFGSCVFFDFYLATYVLIARSRERICSAFCVAHVNFAVATRNLVD